MLLRAGQATDRGPRAENQDAAFADPRLGVAVVADGMGGAAGGAEASRMTVEFTRWFLERNLGDARRAGAVSDLLLRLFVEVNGWVHGKAQAVPELRGMGTTLVVLAVSGDEYHVAHAGDSRAWLLRGGRLTQLTRDHSLVQARVDAGLIRPEDAARQPDRNVITRAVGVDPQLDPDVGEGEARDGDRFVLTTDGIHGVVAAGRLGELAGSGDPQPAAEALVREALSQGTGDNCTAALLAVGEVAAAPGSDPPGRSPTPLLPRWLRGLVR